MTARFRLKGNKNLRRLGGSASGALHSTARAAPASRVVGRYYGYSNRAFPATVGTAKQVLRMRSFAGINLIQGW